MKRNKKGPSFGTGDITSKSTKGSYGIDYELSLQSVEYATTLNTYLNERAERDQYEND
ncbi:hypothetical protein ACFYKX_18970 [Cytobacillus sp. FJAT-54145]|uniref:Uncharacterized protein n=1 Tax=Cytobacillus spartinae TaxID=3299023 RepID=A0ABW6KET3_9BACI